MKRRLTIYATYRANGSNNDYMFYMADSLSEISDVCIVSNRTLCFEEKGLYRKYWRLFERGDEGFDVGGYSYALDKLSEEGLLESYDELILLNDSIFGPFYPLESMFDEMDKKCPDVDFWGITKRGVNDFDGGEKIYPEHIQLYFYVIRKSMFHSRCFLDYMESIPAEITDFRSAIFKYEFSFTDYFVKCGYSYDVYCNTEDYLTENPHYNLSPYHYGMYDLIKNKQCPFIKRKLFTGEFVDKSYTDASDLKRAFDFIKYQTTYNTEFIWNHILSTYNIADIMTAMQLTEVIDSQHSSELYDERKADEIIHTAILANGLYELNAEYILYISNGLNDNLPVILGKSQINNLVNNLFADSEYLDKILSLFEKDNRLGIVIPPAETYGGVEKSLCGIWKSEDVFNRISQKYEIDISLKSKAIHGIRGFIARKDILENSFLEEIHCDKTGTAIQMIPVIAQKKGYYTKTIINASYVPTLLNNMSNIAEALAGGYQESEKERTFKQLKIEKNMTQIKAAIDCEDNIYIYGAGGSALEIIDSFPNDIKIRGIVVTDTNGNEEYLKGIKVSKFSDVKDEKAFFILAVGNKNIDAVKRKLDEAGYRKYIAINE